MRTLSFFAALLFPFVLPPETRAAPAQGGASVPSYRYLFLVDTSYSMRRQKQGLVSSMQQMVQGGFQWKIQPGETFGIWTFNEDVDTTSFTPQTWTPGQNSQMARLAANHISRQRFDKKANWEKAMNKVAEAIERSDLLTLFILSDGQGPISGTPLDEHLNALYQQHGSELQRLRRPFITTFLLDRGDILLWSVGAAGEPIEILDYEIPEADPKVAESAPEDSAYETGLEAVEPLEIAAIGEHLQSVPFELPAASNSVIVLKPQELVELQAPLPAYPLREELKESEETSGQARSEITASSPAGFAPPVGHPALPESPGEALVQAPPLPAPYPPDRLAVRPPKPSADLVPSSPPNRIAQLVAVKPDAPLSWAKPADAQAPQSSSSKASPAGLPAPELNRADASGDSAGRSNDRAPSGVEAIAVVQPGYSWLYKGAALGSLLLAVAMFYSLMRSRTASKDSSFISRSMKNQNLQGRN